MAQMQIEAIDTIRLARDAGPRVRTAAVELARWIERLGARKPTIGADAGDVTALLSTNATDLEPEHFCIDVESAATLHITGGDGRGLLYGVQECIDRARLGRAIMTMTDGPHFALRSLDMWETPSSMVWCLPFDSILDYDKMLRPEEIPEYLDFARRLLAMRVNSLTLFSQYASRGVVVRTLALTRRAGRAVRAVYGSFWRLNTFGAPLHLSRRKWPLCDAVSVLGSYP